MGEHRPDLQLQSAGDIDGLVEELGILRDGESHRDPATIFVAEGEFAERPEEVGL